ncbi:MAG: acetyl-CoA carboxylase, biotin carboxyl carrier protein [Elusimicrobia bacterium]|nr:acetyl-CoA carboxylase, biotin carboxyl carrier protein [Elusimicrobiota bacterium]
MPEPTVLDESYLLSLVEFAKSVDLEEVVWENGCQRIAFKRRPAAAPAISAPTGAAGPAAENQPAASKAHAVPSPMVGTFLRAPSKDRPPFVVEGDEVTVGQRLAVVEAMKVPKDVLSDANGRITRILVENGKPVEYGQKLFEMEK